MMKILSAKLLTNHPLGALYGTLLGIIAFFAARPLFASGMWDAALVDLAMAVLLILLMLRSFTVTCRREATLPEKCTAWTMLIAANILALLPRGDFPGSLSSAFALSLLICAFVLYFSNWFVAVHSVTPALWCCVFMPYHEEFMLLMSYPLRLSATMLSAGILKLCGIGVVYSGTSLSLPDLNIAITDACSGINQLDAFILIAFAVVEILHKKVLWKILHFSFLIPAIIIGNSLRIVLTVILSRVWGDMVLQNSWHTALGYVQILLALLIFIAVGKVFAVPETQTTEGEQ